MQDVGQHLDIFPFGQGWRMSFFQKHRKAMRIVPRQDTDGTVIVSKINRTGEVASFVSQIGAGRMLLFLGFPVETIASR